MLTRKGPSCALIMLAATSTGLFASQRAAAIEEIVVDGTQAAALAAAERAYFRSEIREYVRSLGTEIKSTLGNGAKQLPAPKLMLAESEARIRG